MEKLDAITTLYLTIDFIWLRDRKLKVIGDAGQLSKLSRIDWVSTS